MVDECCSERFLLVFETFFSQKLKILLVIRSLIRIFVSEIFS